MDRTKYTGRRFIISDFLSETMKLNVASGGGLGFYRLTVAGK